MCLNEGGVICKELSTSTTTEKMKKSKQMSIKKAILGRFTARNEKKSFSNSAYVLKEIKGTYPPWIQMKEEIIKQFLMEKEMELKQSSSIRKLNEHFRKRKNGMGFKKITHDRKKMGKFKVLRRRWPTWGTHCRDPTYNYLTLKRERTEEPVNTQYSRV